MTVENDYEADEAPWKRWSSFARAVHNEVVDAVGTHLETFADMTLDEVSSAAMAGRAAADTVDEVASKPSAYGADYGFRGITWSIPKGKQ